MMNVIDLIETEHLDDVKMGWQTVCSFFASQPGFVAGELLETFETVHPHEDFKLTSVCQWESNEAWQAARIAAKNDASVMQRLAVMPARFTPFKGALAAGAGYDVQAGSAGTTVLVDLVYLEEARMEGYARMWMQAKAFMRSHPAYLGASLYRTSESDNPIKYINLAQWRSAEALFSALNTPEFTAILGEYANDFALYLSRTSTCVLSRPPASYMESTK
jgi:heme-degrading monooxygenase HmoA